MRFEELDGTRNGQSERLDQLAQCSSIPLRCDPGPRLRIAALLQLHTTPQQTTHALPGRSCNWSSLARLPPHALSTTSTLPAVHGIKAVQANQVRLALRVEPPQNQSDKLGYCAFRQHRQQPRCGRLRHRWGSERRQRYGSVQNTCAQHDFIAFFGQHIGQNDAGQPTESGVTARI